MFCPPIPNKGKDFTDIYQKPIHFYRYLTKEYIMLLFNSIILILVNVWK